MHPTLELHDAGFLVVPIPPLAKQPKTRAWGKQRYTREHLEAFYEAHSDYNAGVLLGREANLIDIEGDAAGWEQAIRELFGGEPPETFTAHSRRGKHHFFRWDERLAALPGVIKAPPLEFRLGHTGQFQSLVWGEVDYGGEKDFKRTFTLRPVATLPDKAVEKILSLAPARGSESSTDDDWFSSLEKPSFSRVYSAVNALSPRRADDYKTWFDIACALKSCGPDYFSLFDVWSRLSPKYGKTRETWDAIKPDGKIGVGTLFYYARQDGWQEKPQSSELFKVISSADLAIGDYDVEYVIPDVLVARQPMMIGGASKSLKTSTIIDLAISLASKTAFLNHFPVRRPARVLVMSGESGIETLQETAHRVCWSKAIELFDLSRLCWSEDLPACDDPKSLAKLANTITHHSAEFIVIDPAYLCLGSGEDSANVIAQGKLLRSINETCKDVGATLLLVHHSIKSAAKSGKPLHLEDLAMSGFSEFARQWLLLNRREMFVPGERHKLWLTIGGSAGHASLSHLDVDEGSRHDEGGRIWRVNLTDYATALAAEKQTAKNAKDESDIELIVECLSGDSDGLSFSALRAATRFRFDKLRRLLELAPVDKIEVPHPQSKNRMIEGYRLADAA